MNPIIDIHCHIYPDKIADRAIKEISSFYDISVKYDGRIETLKKTSSAAGVSHCVIFSAATTPHQVSPINEYIAAAAAESKGRMTGLGTLHPDSENIKADVEQLISLGLKGVKIHPDAQRFKVDDSRCMKIYEICEEKNLPVLLHCGDLRYDFSNPGRIKPILETFSGLQVIGAHFGGWSNWEQAAEELYCYENFMVDSSSAFKWLDREKAKKIISLYTADRIMFATDYPVWNPKDEIEYMLSLGLNKDEYKKIFYLNAQNVFKIDL